MDERRQSDAYPCNCCGFLTLGDPQPGSYEICPVCSWEDDPVQNEDPLFAGGANSVSLTRARENYIRYGACDPGFSRRVRSPLVNEVPYLPRVTLDSADRIARIRRNKAVLLALARAILCGDVGVLDGCSAVSQVAGGFADTGIEKIEATFIAVAGQRDALDATHSDTIDFERRVKGEVETACRLLHYRLLAELA